MSANVPKICGGFSFARMSKFFGHLKGTIGGSGIAACIQSVGTLKD